MPADKQVVNVFDSRYNEPVRTFQTSPMSKSQNVVAPPAEHRFNRRLSAGFTLVELAIVLVIIGLIVGGVLVGRDMIEAAKLRSILKQADEYKLATSTFKLKYNCLAGDCNNATTFFPADSACTVYGPTSSSFRSYIATPNGQTCNGDGNETIYGPSTAFGEAYLFWQHLSLAGLVYGDLTGASAKSGTDYTGMPYFKAGVNVPITKWGQAMFILINLQHAPGPWTGVNGNHYFWFGNPINTGYWEYWPSRALSPLQAKSLDLKADDGDPITGNIQSDRYWGPGFCYTGAPSAYQLSLTDPECGMLFDAGF